MQEASNDAPLSAVSASSLGTIPKRIRHRENQIESAYELQRVSATIPLYIPSRFEPGATY